MSKPEIAEVVASHELLVHEDDLAEALQDAWNDHCVDTGHIPGFLSFSRDENGSEVIEADFIGSTFSSMVAALLNSRTNAQGEAQPPAK